MLDKFQSVELLQLVADRHDHDFIKKALATKISNFDFDIILKLTPQMP